MWRVERRSVKPGIKKKVGKEEGLRFGTVYRILSKTSVRWVGDGVGLSSFVCLEMSAGDAVFVKCGTNLLCVLLLFVVRIVSRNL